MKLLEARVIAYAIMAIFIVPDLMDEYALEVEDRWGDRASTGKNLLSTVTRSPFNKQSYFKGIPIIIVLVLRILLVANGIQSCLCTIDMVP